MNRRSGVSALARALGLAGLLGLTGCPARAKAEAKGPFLSIMRREGATVARGVPPGSIALALGGLPAEELPRLRERLEESMDAAVRRAAPMLYDLDGLVEEAAAPDPDPLRGALPNLPPLTAAANVLGAPWNAPGLSVELGAACQVAASRCVPLVAPALDRGDDALVRRGRALVWTLGNAARLRVPASSRTVLLRSLRETQTRPASTIALVFGESRGTLDEAELDLLRQQARRVLAHLAPDTPRRSWLDALGDARADWELPIALDADEVLVIPRLSALARLPDFDAEIEHAGTFEWVVRPGVAQGP